MVSSSGRRIWLDLTLFWFYIPLLVQAGLHHPRTKHAVSKRDALSDSGLASASWIWASGSTTGNVAFLKTFTNPAGKNSTSATIYLTAVNSAVLWVNQQPIGATNNWQSAEIFTATLNASTNTFSVLAGNNGNSGAPPAGLLASIKVQYNDGSVATIVSDASWLAAVNIPSDFPAPADRSHFTSAAVAASFGSGAWGNSVTLASPDPNAPSLTGGTWIWSTSDAAFSFPAGTVGFRKNVVTPNGKTAQSCTILLTADNTFVLYVNGNYIGAPPNEPDPLLEAYRWNHARQFNVGLNAAANTFTIIVTNFLFPTGMASPAGLVASISIRYTDGSSDVVVTDPSWLNGPYTTVAAFLAAPDSALAQSFNVAAVGAWPWGQILGISDVLAAANVPSPPFSNNIASTTNQGATNPAAGASAGGGAGSGQPSQSGPAGASTTGGASGVPTGSAAGTALHTGSDVTQSTATRGAVNAGGSSGSATAALSSPTGASASSTSSTPVAAIVAAIASTLTLIILGTGIFYWRRRRNPRIVRRQSQGSSITPFVSGLTASDTHDASSVVPISPTSAETVRRPEMAELRPQRLGNANAVSPAVVEQTPQASPGQHDIIPSTKLERENMIQGSAAGSEEPPNNRPVTPSRSPTGDRSSGQSWPIFGNGNHV
ncbi:hypothetical protein MVEN_00752800 [Mycena venus]|uniref:Uncharacterized protein n=1 Tax=Mycena venus TaxID=2733690 RepID=A0A8H6YFJ2_9AGAR|nr:hypothetical protein MVEN_00752800 [Mycena venus]